MGRSNTDTRNSYFEEFGFEKAEKTFEFDGSSGNGAAGTTPVFNVTGEVMMRLNAFCSESLVGAGSTVGVGTTSQPAAILPQIIATELDAGEIWNVVGAASLPTEIVAIDGTGTSDTNSTYVLGTNRDILLQTALDVTDGTLKFVCYWKPVTTGSTLKPA